MPALKIIASQIKEFKVPSVLTPLMMLLEVAMEMVIPLLMASIIDKGVMPGGECYYYASALLSDMGDEAQAIDYLRSALANGYGSLFEVKVNEDPYVNLKLVRRAADFNSVVEQNQQAFQERR